MAHRSPLPGQPAIAAALEIAPGSYPDRDDVGMHREVLSAFTRAFPHVRPEIDGLLVAPAGMASGHDPKIFMHEECADLLGLRPRFAETMNAGGATYGLMIDRAARAIGSGRARAVLCVGAGKFPRVSRGGGEAMARMVSDPDFEVIYGAYIPALYALVAARHMHERGTTREQLASVAVSSRAWALLNPDALMRSRGPLTVEAVLGSRLIAEPFRLFDCSVPCEGGGAFVVARGDVARRLHPRPAYVLGIGELHDHGRMVHTSDFATLGVAGCGQQAFDEAGLAPSRIRVAQIYDAFTINPIVLLEELGLVKRGEGGAFYGEGRGAPGGDLPINTYGGLLSFGHTGDASGLSVIVEAARQIMGDAGARQVRGADVGIGHVYGGMMASHATLIFGVEP